MTPPSIRDIQNDNDLIDALGARKGAGSSDDPMAGMLAAWVDEIDHSAVRKPGRYARVRRGGARIALASVVAAGALSVSSVAAAVTGTQLPVFSQLGHLTHSLVGGGDTTHTTTPSGVVDDVAGTTVTGTMSAPEVTTSPTSSGDTSSSTAVPPSVTDPDRPSSSSSVRIPPPVVHPPWSHESSSGESSDRTSDPQTSTSTHEPTSRPTTGPTSTSGPTESTDPTQSTDPTSSTNTEPTGGPTSTGTQKPPQPTPSQPHHSTYMPSTDWGPRLSMTQTRIPDNLVDEPTATTGVPSGQRLSGDPHERYSTGNPHERQSTGDPHEQSTGEPGDQHPTGRGDGTSSPTPRLPVHTHSETASAAGDR